jgi:protein SMG6
MITFNAFATSREAILAVWSPAAQSRRQQPEASLSDLFVLLHGMIFTNIQMDDFQRVLARFEEKLIIEGK